MNTYRYSFGACCPTKAPRWNESIFPGLSGALRRRSGSRMIFQNDSWKDLPLWCFFWHMSYTQNYTSYYGELNIWFSFHTFLLLVSNIQGSNLNQFKAAQGGNLNHIYFHNSWLAKMPFTKPFLETDYTLGSWLQFSKEQLLLQTAMGQLIRNFKIPFPGIWTLEIQSFKLPFDKQKVMFKCPNQTLQNIQKDSFNLTTRVWKSTCLLAVTT